MYEEMIKIGAACKWILSLLLFHAFEFIHRHLHLAHYSWQWSTKFSLRSLGCLPRCQRDAGHSAACVSPVRIQILQSNSFQGGKPEICLGIGQGRMGLSYRFKFHFLHEVAIVPHLHGVVKLLSIFYELPTKLLIWSVHSQ